MTWKGVSYGRRGAAKKPVTVTVKLRTVEVNGIPYVMGFLQAMKELGAQVEIKGNTIHVAIQ